MDRDESTPKLASSNPLPSDASIDQRIRWLEQLRAKHATAPLSDLIDHHSMSTDLLVELVAVDLIAQRRCGHEVLPEDYLKQFPALAKSDAHLLDLIDAELCVRREMKDARDAEFFIDRFPELADSIRQLVFLDVQPAERSYQPLSDHAESSSPNIALHEASQNSVHGTVDVSISEDSGSDPYLLQRDLTIAGLNRQSSVSTGDSRNDDSIDVPIPIKPPAWMVGARCIATTLTESGRCWLVKGRDKERSDTVAMKIIPLPRTLDRTQRTRMLDLCGITSSVAHPTWVAPRIAAINNGHLAVVRPWIFGNPLAQGLFSSGLSSSMLKQRLQGIVRVAFALSAAHRIGATHGSVHARNIVIDHESNINLIDAASGVGGWEFNLSIWNNDLSQTIDQRISRDTRGLVEMIASECIGSPDREMMDWPGQITSGIEFHENDACVRIGEALQARLDAPMTKQSWWKK